MINENVTKVLDQLKYIAEFEESKNGNKGHVIWSYNFYKLSQAIVKLLNKHIIMPSFAELKEMRLKTRYSMRQISKKTGVSTPTISRIEKGNNAEYQNVKKLYEFYVANEA